jgi:type IV pilus assembly protein PilV
MIAQARRRPGLIAAARRQVARGFTLIEILVSLVVIAIGLVGVAKLQSSSLLANTDAYYASLASFLAYEMAERVRVNPNGNGSYAVAMSTGPSTSLDCVGGPCSASNMARFDVQQWLDIISTSLPEGGGKITYVGGAQDAFGIVVRWKPKLGGNCAADGTAGTDYSCFTLNIISG